MMSAYQRVQAACAFNKPDRIPRYDKFWAYPPDWQARFGPQERLSDVLIIAPDETAFPTRACRLRDENGVITEIEPWGRTISRREGSYFTETLAVPLPEGIDPEAVTFDDPLLKQRYLLGSATREEADLQLAAWKNHYCLFIKTGGPYLRSTFIRGEEQFLFDMAGEPELARTMAEKVTEHITTIGITALRRWGLQDTGIWIYDDMACNRGPMFSPQTFEDVLLPCYRRMIRAYKEADARYVLLHSDGNILPILDMLVDAGIDGLNPLERRAHMHPLPLRLRYPQLILTGGMCNTDTLIHGPIARIEAEARELIELGRDGGVIIGTHSISPEIPLEHFAAYDAVCRTYGDFTVVQA